MTGVGELRLDHATLELRHGGDVVRMSAKPFSLLRFLAERVGRVVARDELLAALWPEQVVSEAALGSAVREVRRAFKALGIAEEFRLEVVRSRGYRFSTPETRAHPEQGAAPSGSVSRPALVGRQPELERLRSLLSRAGAGGPRAVLVSGPAGIGKTRLAAEFEAMAESKGYRTVWGRCIEGQAVEFSVWADVIRNFVRPEDPDYVQSVLGPVAPELVRALPSLRPLGTAPEGEPNHTPELARLALLDGFIGLLNRIGDNRGCVYFLEDVQWADATSLQLLQTLASQQTANRMLLVLTHRDDEPETRRRLGSLFSDLERIGVGTTIDLRPLSPGDSERLLDALGPKRLSTDRTAELVQIACGNPFFLEELYQHAVESGSDGALPERLERLVLRRIESRSEKARSLIECASVVGRDFDARFVSALSDDDGGALDELCDAGLIGPGLRRGQYRFNHAVHQQVVYASIPRSRRAHLHLRVGKWLEDTSAASPVEAGSLGEVAFHYDEAVEAGGARAAYRYRVLAGEEALERYSLREATHHFARAAEILELPPAPGDDPIATDEERCKRLAVLARTARLAGEGATCQRALQTAIPLARTLDSPWQLAACLTGAPFFAWADREIVELHEEALARLGPEPTLLRSATLASLAQRLSDIPGTRDRQLALVDEALEISDGDRPARLRLYILEASSATLMSVADVERRELWADEMVAIGRSENSLMAATQGHMYRWAVRVQRGRVADALEEMRAVEEIARRHPWARNQGSANAMRTVVELIDARLEAADECVQRTAEMMGEFGDGQATMILGLQMAFLRREQGRFAEVEGLVDVLAAQAPVLGWTKDVVLAELGSVEARKRLLHSTFEENAGPRGHGSPALRLPGLCWMAGICDKFADATYAAELVRELLPSRGSWPSAGAAAFWTFGSVHRALGILEMLQGRLPEAVRELETAMQTNDQPGAELHRLWTCFDLARALTQRGAKGDRERARRLLEDVETSSEHLGLVELGSRAAAFQGHGTATA